MRIRNDWFDMQMKHATEIEQHYGVINGMLYLTLMLEGKTVLAFEPIAVVEGLRAGLW